ncbi:MAG: hypothetical protein GF341_09965 [candidate division Zixibacteria bacterium]|nr:hypothetical protein [candidate division Zixibacteria bacterium]
MVSDDGVIPLAELKSNQALPFARRTDHDTFAASSPDISTVMVRLAVLPTAAESAILEAERSMPAISGGGAGSSPQVERSIIALSSPAPTVAFRILLIPSISEFIRKVQSEACFLDCPQPHHQTSTLTPTLLKKIGFRIEVA